MSSPSGSRADPYGDREESSAARRDAVYSGVGPRGRARPVRARTAVLMEFSVLDIVYVAGIIAVFAIIALVARGVEKLGPRAGGSGHGEAVVRGEQGGPRARGSGHGEAMGGEERA